jgi:hypothetical protein
MGQPLAQSLDLDQTLAGGHATSDWVPFLDLNKIQSSRAQIIVRGEKRKGGEDRYYVLHL